MSSLLLLATTPVIPVRLAAGLGAAGVIAILVGSGRHHRGAMISACIATAVLVLVIRGA